MKKVILFSLLTVTYSLFLGCATTPPAIPENDVLLPEIDIITVKENSDEALKLAQEAKLDVEIFNSRITEVNNQLLNFSEEMASVSSAKMEEIENRLSILTEEVKNIYFELDSLRKRVRAPKRKNKPNVFSMSTFRPGSSEANAILSPAERKYRIAQTFFNNRKYLSAVVAFKEALKLAPNGKHADDCRYFASESYFLLKQYARAIAGYKKVFSYTTTDKGDDAQMQIAICYSKLGDNAQAVEEFKRLLKVYPQSEYEKKAKKLIMQLE